MNTNLRATTARVLKSVGAPLKIADNSRPVSLMQFDGRKILVYLSDNRLRFFDALADPDTQKIEIDDFALDSQFLSLSSDNGNIIVMTRDRQIYLRFDNQSSKFREIDFRQLPAFSLVTKRLADCSTRIGQRTLSRTYSTGELSLDASDLKHVSDDLRQAYLDCDRQARMSGAFIAARLCRYRLIDRYGETLFTSPALLLGADDTDRLTAAVTFRSLDRRTLEALDFNLPLWRPCLLPNIDNVVDISNFVSHVAIDVSAGLHPYSKDQSASATLVKASSANDFMRAVLPGASRSASAANGSGAVDMIYQLLGRSDDLWSTVSIFRIENILKGLTPDSITCSRCSSVSDDCKTIDKALAKAPQTAEANSSSLSSLSSLSSPHSFTASCVASSADTELWGDLSVIRYRGHPAELLAAELNADCPWQAAVAVDFINSDEQVVAVSNGLTNAPLKFNPVLSYPSPDARSMTIIVDYGGRTRCQTFYLTPDPSLRHSVYISPGFKPLELNETLSSFAVPPERRVSHRLPSTVCLTNRPRDGSLLNPVAVSTLGNGEVKAIRPCVRRNSGLENSSIRYNVFSTAGIHTTSLSSKQLKSTLIDNASVSSSNCAVQMDGHLYAIADKRLIDVGPNGTTTLIKNIDADTIAVAPAYNELWLGGRNSAVRVIDIGDLSSYLRTETDLGASVGSYAELGGNTACLDRETADERYIRWVKDFDFGRRFVSLRCMTVDLLSSNVTDLEIALRRLKFDNFETFASSRFKISGKVLSPFSLPLMALPMLACRVEIQGIVAPSTIINSISLQYDTTRNSL